MALIFSALILSTVAVVLQDSLAYAKFVELLGMGRKLRLVTNALLGIGENGMTDRELLELAAKAIGKTLVPFEELPWLDEEGTPYWNPLTDDGDAFRLMVDMRLPLDIEDYATYVYPLGVHVDHEDKPEAATRRAIVIAAAEMGRRME